MLLSIILVLLLFLLVTAALPPGGFFSGDQGVRYEQVDTIARQGTPVIGGVDGPLSVFRPGFGRGFYVPFGGGVEVKFSLIYAFLVLPFYLLFGMYGLVLPSVLGVVLAACGTAGVASSLGVRRPWAAGLVVALATPLAFYGAVLWDHALAVGVIALGCHFLLRGKLSLAGALIAVASWLRPESALLLPAVAIAAIVTQGLRPGVQVVLRVGTGFAATMVPWALFNVTTTGTLLGMQLQMDPPLQYLAPRAGGQAVRGVSTPVWREQADLLWGRGVALAIHLISMGWKKWLMLVLGTILAAGLLRMARRPMIFTLYLFSFGVAAITLAQLLQGNPGFGLMDAFPFGFAAFLALAGFKTDRSTRVLVTVGVGYLVVAGLLMPPFGGASWGPRFLLGLYPILAVLAWRGFELCRDRLGRVALLALLLSSLAVQCAGLLSLKSTETQYTTLSAELLSLEPRAVATGIWWLPQVAATTRQDVRWYGLVSESELSQLSASEGTFWWVWTEEGSDRDTTMAVQRTLPASQFLALEEIQLSTRRLHAVLYQTIPSPTGG